MTKTEKAAYVARATKKLRRAGWVQARKAEPTDAAELVVRTSHALLFRAIVGTQATKAQAAEVDRMYRKAFPAVIAAIHPPKPSAAE
jgi:hypothetical protein